MWRAFATSKLDVVSTFNLNELQRIAYIYYLHSGIRISLFGNTFETGNSQTNRIKWKVRSDITAFKKKLTTMVSSKLPLKISTGFPLTTTSDWNIQSLKKTEKKTLKLKRTNHSHHQPLYSFYDTLLSTVYKDGIFLV